MNELPGKGLFGWLGRQVGYITRAARKDVTRQTVYREQDVQEATLPQNQNVTLRRTTIDEIIVEEKRPSQNPS